MSRGWDAVGRVGASLFEHGQKRRALEDERKYLERQAALEADRELKKAKALQQLEDDNKAAREAAKAAREQVLNLGDGQVGIYYNDPDGRIKFRIEGKRRPQKGQIVTTDAGVFDYNNETGQMTRLGGAKPSPPAAWNDPSTIVRDLDEEWSRVRTQLDTKISDIESALADPIESARNGPALRIQLENMRNLKAERKAEIDARKAAVMGDGSSGSSPQQKASSTSLMDILSGAAKTALEYGRDEGSTMRGVTSGAVPVDVGASAIAAQTGKPVNLSIGGKKASATPPSEGPARPKAQEAKGKSATWAAAYAEAIRVGATPEQATILADEVEAEANSGG